MWSRIGRKGGGGYTNTGQGREGVYMGVVQTGVHRFRLQDRVIKIHKVFIW